VDMKVQAAKLVVFLAVAMLIATRRFHKSLD